jgi:hypothetical protein
MAAIVPPVGRHGVTFHAYLVPVTVLLHATTRLKRIRSALEQVSSTL